MQSPSFSLNRADLTKIGKGLVIALAGAALTYVTETLPNVELGLWTPMVMAFWSVVANAVRKLLTGPEVTA